MLINPNKRIVNYFLKNPRYSILRTLNTAFTTNLKEKKPNKNKCLSLFKNVLVHLLISSR